MRMLGVVLMVEFKKCPKCSGNMELGELELLGAPFGPLKWSQEASRTIGIGKWKAVHLNSYRCYDCGFIENYAPSEKRKKYEKDGPREIVEDYQKVLGFK